MADRDIEQVADLYADPHPGDTAPRWLTARLGETGQAESEIPATVAEVRGAAAAGQRRGSAPAGSPVAVMLGKQKAPDIVSVGYPT